MLYEYVLPTTEAPAGAAGERRPVSSTVYC